VQKVLAVSKVPPFNGPALGLSEGSCTPRRAAGTLGARPEANRKQAEDASLQHCSAEQSPAPFSSHTQVYNTGGQDK